MAAASATRAAYEAPGSGPASSLHLVTASAWQMRPKARLTRDMSSPPTPPHLADLQFSYATAERTEEFLTAVLRGFYDDYQPEIWGPGRAVFEPERSFGFTVDGRWVTTCGAYSRRLSVPGGVVPVAAVSVVTVNPSYRRRGLLRQMMTHQLNAIAERGAEPLAYLWASEAAIYGRFGYGETGPKVRLSGRTQATAFRPGVGLGDGSVGEVDRDAFRAVVPALHAGWLAERPGALARTERWWDVAMTDPEPWRDGATARRFALHYAGDGTPDGYLSFHVKDKEGTEAEVRVLDLDADDPAAYASLWRFALDLDLVRNYVRGAASVEDPLRHLLADNREVRTELSDGTYARIVDVRRALEARRYAVEIEVVIGVVDPLLPANSGAFRLRGGPDGADVTRVTQEPNLTLDVRELGAIYLGGVPLGQLQRAGLVRERTPGAIAAITAAFAWSRLPFCPDPF